LSLRKQKLEDHFLEKRKIIKILKEFREAENIPEEIVNTMNNLQNLDDKNKFLNFLLKNDDEDIVNYCLNKFENSLSNIEKFKEQLFFCQNIFSKEVVMNLLINLKTRENFSIKVDQT
jgi:hypothetical protein